MNRNFISLLLSVLIFALTSCDKPAPETPQTPQEPETPEQPQQPEEPSPAPDPAPFALKVYDISSVSVTVEVQPLDDKSPYYTDVINEADFQQAQKYGFDDYMAWFTGSMMEQTGQPLPKVLEMISSYGNDGFILTSLKPESTYYAFAVGIGDDGMTTTEVVYEKFVTPEKEVSENTFELTAEDITATTATIRSDVSNEDAYILAIEPLSTVKDLADEELADYIIQNNIAWGGLEAITYHGDQMISWEGKAGWDYVLVAFGYERGAVTTDIVRKVFTMGKGGNPAGCSFTFGQEFEAFEMNLSITPSDNSVVYICNYVEMSDLQSLMAANGSLDAALGECLELLIEDMVEDLGSSARVVDLISAMGAQTFNVRFDPLTEYVQWAVPVDQDGNPTASFSFSSPFISPEEKLSDASIRVKDYTYYDGTELAAMYPEFSMAKGYAVVDLLVDPNIFAEEWWSYIAMEDLTDRSRDVIIKNLLAAPTEANLKSQHILAYWGTNTIMGVARDADGIYGPLLLQVIDLKKEEASPASEFHF